MLSGGVNRKFRNSVTGCFSLAIAICGSSQASTINGVDSSQTSQVQVPVGMDSVKVDSVSVLKSEKRDKTDDVYYQRPMAFLELGGWYLPPNGFVLATGGSLSGSSGFTKGFTVQFGKLEDLDDKVMVCDRYGLGSNCEERTYSRKIYGLDLFVGMTRKMPFAPWFGLRGLGGVTLDMVTDDVGTDCLNCDKNTDWVANIFVRPEVVFFMGRGFCFAVGPRLDFDGLTSGIGFSLGMLGM